MKASWSSSLSRPLLRGQSGPSQGLIQTHYWTSAPCLFEPEGGICQGSGSQAVYQVRPPALRECPRPGTSSGLGDRGLGGCG